MLEPLHNINPNPLNLLSWLKVSILNSHCHACHTICPARFHYGLNASTQNTHGDKRSECIQLFHHSNLHLSIESSMTQVPVITFHINHPYCFQVCEALHQTNVLPHLPTWQQTVQYRRQASLTIFNRISEKCFGFCSLHRVHTKRFVPKLLMSPLVPGS